MKGAGNETKRLQTTNFMLAVTALSLPHGCGTLIGCSTFPGEDEAEIDHRLKHWGVAIWCKNNIWISCSLRYECAR